MKFPHLPEKAREILTQTGAFQEGHFQLTSGLHSGGYLQCALILQYPQHAEFISRELARHLADKNPDVVLSPALGGIVLSYELARALSCRGIFAERVGGEMKLRRGFSIRENERVLIAEDVVTTGGSVQELKTIAEAAGAKVVGFTAICDRSNGRFNPSEGLYPWVTFSIETFAPDACPLCRDGIPISKPGSRWKP
jgi:orotate phosphoribosyltransferase